METTNLKLTAKDWKAKIKPNWCPGCGDYGLLSATTKVLAKLGYTNEEVIIVSGIGCSGSFPHWTTAYGIHVVHGRTLPTALGIHMVNPKLKVIVVGGDGDGFGIGAGHFVHASRRNLDITYMVMNNQTYGLTLGQASPSTPQGQVSKNIPLGVDEKAINPITLSLASGATFISRGYSGDSKQLQSIIEEGLKHKGFSFIDVISPCVTFNRVNTYDWFNERLYHIEKDHQQDDKVQAFTKSLEWGDKIPTGIFYQVEEPTLVELNEYTKNNIAANSKLGILNQGITAEEVFSEFR